MRKLIKYFLIIVIIIVAMPSKNLGLEELIKSYNIENAINTYYTTNADNIENAKIVRCGSAVFVQSNVTNCENIKKKLTNIQGQSISFSGSLGLYSKLVNDLIKEKALTENVSNVQTCYGFNDKLNNYITLNNSKINIQIAFNNEVITIGTPVILGSY